MILSFFRLALNCSVGKDFLSRLLYKNNKGHFTVHPDDMDRPSERIRRSRSDAIR